MKAKIEKPGGTPSGAALPLLVSSSAPVGTTEYWSARKAVATINLVSPKLPIKIGFCTGHGAGGVLVQGRKAARDRVGADGCGRGDGVDWAADVEGRA